MGEWKEMTLAQVCAESSGGIQTGPFGSQLHAEDYVPKGIPVVMPQDISDNRIDPAAIARISVKDRDRLLKHALRTGDIVYSRRGDVGRRALVREDNEGWLCGTGCLRVRVADQRVHDSTFLSYLLGTEGVRAWIVRHAVGATMLNLNTSILGHLPLRVPGVSTQRAIAEVLGALDDKITANDRALSVGDSLVRADFAHLSGEPITLEDLVTSVREQVDPTSRPAATPYVGLEHVPRRRMWLQAFGTAKMVASAKSSFQEGDVLFGKLRPYFHKVVRAPSSGIASTDILVLRAKRPELAGLALAAASSDGAVAAATGAADGTRMPRANWSVLKEVLVPWPGETEAVRFSRRVDGVARLAAGLAAETRALGSTRDELLPLLMSGRLRVKDAEKVVAEVV